MLMMIMCYKRDTRRISVFLYLNSIFFSWWWVIFFWWCVFLSVCLCWCILGILCFLKVLCWIWNWCKSNIFLNLRRWVRIIFSSFRICRRRTRWFELCCLLNYFCLCLWCLILCLFCLFLNCKFLFWWWWDVVTSTCIWRIVRRSFCAFLVRFWILGVCDVWVLFEKILWCVFEIFVCFCFCKLMLCFFSSFSRRFRI